MVKTNTGARAIYSCATSLWNNLPLSFRKNVSLGISLLSQLLVLRCACCHCFEKFDVILNLTFEDNLI